MLSRIDGQTKLSVETGALFFLTNSVGSHFSLVTEMIRDKSDAYNSIRESYGFICTPNLTQLENKPFSLGKAVYRLERIPEGLFLIRVKKDTELPNRLVCLEEETDTLFFIEFNQEGQELKRSPLPASESDAGLRRLCRANSPDSIEGYKLIRAAQGLTTLTYWREQLRAPDPAMDDTVDFQMEELPVPKFDNVDATAAFYAAPALGDYTCLQAFPLSSKSIMSGSIFHPRGRAIRPYAQYLSDTFGIQIKAPAEFPGTVEEWLDTNAKTYAKPEPSCIDSSTMLGIATGLAAGLTGAGLLLLLCAVAGSFAMPPLGFACLVGAIAITGGLAAIGLYKVNHLSEDVALMQRSAIKVV